MRKRLNNIFFIVGLAAVIIMLITFDVSFAELWRCVQRAGYWVVAIVGLWALLYVMNTFAWRAIIKGSGDCPISFARLYKLTVSGFALNYATPLGLMGGEAYRISELSRYIGIQRATSSVILFVMMHIFSHFWFWVTGVITYIALSCIGDVAMSVPMALVLAFVIVFCYVGIYFFVKGYRNGMVVKFIKFLSHIPGLRNWGTRFAHTHSEDLAKIDRQIAELQAQNKRTFFTSLILEYVGRLCQCFEIMFMLLLFGIDNGGGWSGMALTYLHAFLILAFTSLFANLLGFLPLQLGGREGGFAMSVTQLGMTNEIAMFVSIICRAREILWTFIGLLLIKISAEGDVKTDACDKPSGTIDHPSMHCSADINGLDYVTPAAGYGRETFLRLSPIPRVVRGNTNVYSNENYALYT